jgi:hypothetical protein
MSDIDLDFRPAGYFWPHSLSTHLLSTVKGAARQKYIQSLIAQDRLDELEGYLAKESLSDSERSATGRVHPMFMGGEYLPNLRKGEIEIARISLRSTTYDVISVRATRAKTRIRYRIVDEYQADSYLNGPGCHRTSIRPLTLGQLEQFIEGAQAGMEIVRSNLDHDCLGGIKEYVGFLCATSQFYPQLKALYELRFDQLAQSRKTPDDAVEETRQSA